MSEETERISIEMVIPKAQADELRKLASELDEETEVSGYQKKVAELRIDSGKEGGAIWIADKAIRVGAMTMGFGGEPQHPVK